MFRKGMLVWCKDPGSDMWLNFRSERSPLVVTHVQECGTPDERVEMVWVEHKGETRGGYESSRFQPSRVPLVIGEQYRVDGEARTLREFRVAFDDSCAAVLEDGEERALLDLRPMGEG